MDSNRLAARERAEKLFEDDPNFTLADVAAAILAAEQAAFIRAAELMRGLEPDDGPRIEEMPPVFGAGWACATMHAQIALQREAKSRG